MSLQMFLNLNLIFYEFGLRFPVLWLGALEFRTSTIQSSTRMHVLV